MQKMFSPFIRFSLLFLSLVSVPNLVQAAELSFAWTPNTDANLAGYKIYYGTASGTYTVSIDVGNPAITDNKVTCTLTVLPKEDTVYYFAATAYDVDQLESDYSDEVAVNVSAEVNDTEAVFLFLTDGLPQEDITAVEESALLKVWQDQKLSRDLYQSFYTAYSLPIFTNTMSDAQHYMDFVHILLGKFGVPVPQDIAGLFTDQDTQNLFDLMLSSGNGSSLEGLHMGAAAEDRIIDEMQSLLPQIDNQEILFVYQNLLRSARNHLRLYVNALSQEGSSYSPQYLSGDDYAAVISSPVEMGIYDQNGDTLYENGEWFVTATLAGSNQIDLTWMDPGVLIDAATITDPTAKTVFRIERSVNGGAFTFLAKVGTGTTNYSDITVEAGDTYEYRVIAVRAYSIGIFLSGTWALDLNGNNVWDKTPTDGLFKFGMLGDIPVSGDWNGDGITEIGVFRNGTWYFDLNGNNVWDGAPTDALFKFGILGDIPVTGDWNGDGTTEIGVFRNATWYLDLNDNKAWDGTPTDGVFEFGNSGDIPVAGDWNGDGTTEIGVFRNGTWYLDLTGNNVWDGLGTDSRYTYGTVGDKPVSLAP